MEETAWIEAARDGDGEAWEQLVRSYQGALYGFALRMTGGAEAAEDATQETWVRAVTALDSFTTGSSFKAWLFTILANLLRDRHRKAARRPTTVSAEDASLSDPSSSAEWPALGRELASALDEAYRCLPEDQREVLLLRTVEGLSYEEIVEITETPLATVRWRVHRARERLRKELKPWLERSKEGQR